jgi:hypothetical protein
MRYCFPVTDFIHEHSLRHLSATEARLSNGTGAAGMPSRKKLPIMMTIDDLMGLDASDRKLTVVVRPTASPTKSRMAACRRDR